MANLSKKDVYINNPPDGIPLFHQPFWLNAVHGSNWDVALVTNDMGIVASMPYCVENGKYGTSVVQPALTQFLGPYFNVQSDKKVKLYSQETDILKGLLSQLPQFHKFHQNWHFAYQNWLPYYWEGFSQTTRYTYFIDKAIPVEEVWQGFKDTVRNDIRKADKFILVREAFDCKLLYSLVQSTFDKKGGDAPYSFDQLDRITAILKERSLCKMFFASDKSDPTIVHAGILVIEDINTNYYLVGASNRQLKNTGALSRLIWEAIKYSLEAGKSFDFEGSVLPTVEPFFRYFGGERKPYFSISKINFNRRHSLEEGLRHLKRFITGPSRV